MKFNELIIGDVFKKDNMIYKKSSSDEGEYSIDGYNRIFEQDAEVEIMAEHFKVLFKNESWIPSELRGKIEYVKRVPYYAKTSVGFTKIPVYSVISKPSDYMMSPHSFNIDNRED